MAKKKSKPTITSKARAKKAINKGTSIRVSKDAVDAIVETGDKYVTVVGDKALMLAQRDKRKTVQEADVMFSTRFVNPEHYNFSQADVKKSREGKPRTAKQKAADAQRRKNWASSKLAKSKAKAKSKPKSKAQTKVQPKAKPKAKAKPASKAKAKPKRKVQATLV